MGDDDIRELNRLRKEKEKLRVRKKFLEMSNVCNRMGEILSRQGKYEEALYEHQDEESACVELDDFLGVAIANRKIGECHSELGSYSQALEHQRKHLEIAVRLKNVVEEQRAWATIGRTHLYQAEVPSDKKKTDKGNNLDSETLVALNRAEEAFLKSLDLCSRLVSNVAAKEMAQMQGRLFLNLGLVLEQRGDLDGCSQFIQKAIRINEDHHLAEDLQRCHHSLCLLHKRHGHLAIALTHARDAIKIATKSIDLEEECELLTLHGHICLLLSDFSSAKQVLRRLKKKAGGLAEGKTKSDAFRIWKAAVKLSAAEERLLCLESDNVDAQRTTYEKMGDLCCRVENYEKALQYYHRSLELTEELGLDNMNLAPLYLSLAQTYCDTGQYAQAIHYYQLELNCWFGNPVETCKTLLNIAECEESNGKDFMMLLPLYMTALESADKSNDERLVRRCLQLLATIKSTFAEQDEHKETLNRIEALAVAEDGDDDMESTEESEVTIDSSVPSDDSSTDDEVNEGSSTCDVNQSRRKKFHMRRNEKGETPLHRACIDGDAKLAKKLLDQGHPVNIRDHSGWLPLHEAANHDYVHIVELLLDHGAWINDRGGEHCDGITPLHDAASNGNLSVIRVLLERGASILAKTASGETVLGCLIKWQERAENSTDPEILSESVRLADELKDAVKSATEKLQGTGCASTSRVIVSEPDVGYSTCDALISEDVGTELNLLPADGDWLVEDVRPVQNSRKRRRSNQSPVYNQATSIRRMNNTSDRRRVVRMNTPKMRHMSMSIRDRRDDSDRESTMDGSFLDIEDDNRKSPWHVPCPHSPSNEVLQSRIFEQSRLEFAADNVTRPTPTLLRVKVKILDKLLLVPVPSGETIGWLANEAAHRYYMLHGLRPVLSLSTKEGALLTVVDTAHHVISAEDEESHVVGTVESWDLPPLSERYAQACAAFSESPCANVTDIFSRLAMGTVCMRNLRLTVNRFRPICRALQCQYSLTELVLANNCFGDEGLQLLSPALLHLPSLHSLDLSCNDITDIGLGYVASAVSASTLSLQRLKIMKLGFNPLISGLTCPNFRTLFGALPALEELHLQSCCEADQWLDSDALASLSRVTSLRHLDLSFNRLSQEQAANQLSSVLAALPLLRKLYIRGVAASLFTARALCEALVQLYVKNPGCQLDELDLALCSLDDVCITTFAEVVTQQRRSKLKFVDLSCNAGLSLSSSLRIAEKSISEVVRFSSKLIGENDSP